MTASAWGRSASPISVRRTGRGPPGRLNNDAPTSRSSAATCWLTPDWV